MKYPGRTINTSPVPEAGEPPSANTAGKIAIPAITAIRVSAIPTNKAEDARFSFLRIYEPYVIKSSHTNT